MAGSFLAGIGALYLYSSLRGKAPSPVTIGSSEENLAARYPAAPAPSAPASITTSATGDSVNPLRASTSAASDPRGAVAGWGER